MVGQVDRIGSDRIGSDHRIGGIGKFALAAVLYVDILLMNGGRLSFDVEFFYFFIFFFLELVGCALGVVCCGVLWVSVRPVHRFEFYAEHRDFGMVRRIRLVRNGVLKVRARSISRNL
ncbi:hypothetical protein BDV96DRAFT_583266 [Lophiotrema nucula]|uniref:Uncharacterized protein n=1 Tax=Lophiotrema nucula TaxID=690887 RepID=A0A6A5YUX1_9PLEO|nr:hypothetical protein BDV96DRAFT_583266 [Lophiotrema nucula]